MRLSTVYSNRSVDILMLKVPSSGEGQVELKLDDPVKICTGVQKLSQRFIVFLLTGRRTVFNNLQQGTLVGDMLITGTVPARRFIRNYFMIAVKTVRNQIIEAQTSDTNPEETLKDATLASLTIGTDGRISCSIELSTGDGSIYIVPLSIGP